ncbi:hypothetical protein DXT99_18715 [Pontibacter diazotrophicus]|uniref:Uncharacterized protein n=1 Tax=Pontibacter diazotrophicus TaxID=1400979 RepID=A0A3D8L9B5_9BACT|nr:hypothetical protein DXT99_18715 [Pontibacter diazotrophicus]
MRAKDDKMEKAANESLSKLNLRQLRQKWRSYRTRNIRQYHSSNQTKEAALAEVKAASLVILYSSKIASEPNHQISLLPLCKNPGYKQHLLYPTSTKILIG